MRSLINCFSSAWLCRDYGTFSRMYAPFGLNEDDYATRKRSPSIDTEFRGKTYPASLRFALRGIID